MTSQSLGESLLITLTKSIGLAVASFTGSVTAIITQAHQVLSLVAVVVSIICGIYSIRASRNAITKVKEPLNPKHLLASNDDKEKKNES